MLPLSSSSSCWCSDRIASMPRRSCTLPRHSMSSAGQAPSGAAPLPVPPAKEHNRSATTKNTTKRTKATEMSYCTAGKGWGEKVLRKSVHTTLKHTKTKQGNWETHCFACPNTWQARWLFGVGVTHFLGPTETLPTETGKWLIYYYVFNSFMHSIVICHLKFITTRLYV